VVPAANDTISCVQPSVALSGAAVIPAQEVVWSWTTADGNIVSGVNSSTPVVNAPGTYEVTATNVQTGCSESATTAVINDEEVTFDASLLRFPNIVTPNGDNRNERWRPFLSNAPEFDVLALFSSFSIQVFDRWGGLVFESTSGGWDASEVSAGTYYYIVQYATLCGGGAGDTLEGSVKVVR
jgi:gliding motility-associated-like protein